jgi:hypothetical protein
MIQVVLTRILLFLLRHLVDGSPNLLKFVGVPPYNSRRDERSGYQQDGLFTSDLFKPGPLERMELFRPK